MALPYTLISALPTRIGLIVLQSDETLEHDMRRLLPADVDMLVTRVPSSVTVTPDTLRAMEPELTRAASLLPRAGSFAAVGYGCTSASAHIGATSVAARIKAGVQTEQVTEPVSALIAACKHLKCNNIGLISPYTADVSDRLIDVMQAAKINVCDFASFEEPVEERVVRISPDALRRAAIEMGKSSDCDAIFLSCTNLRTLDVIAAIEDATGKPVLSSNQVLAWHLGQIGGFSVEHTQMGRLFKA